MHNAKSTFVNRLSSCFNKLIGTGYHPLSFSVICDFIIVSVCVCSCLHVFVLCVYGPVCGLI